MSRGISLSGLREITDTARHIAYLLCKIGHIINPFLRNCVHNNQEGYAWANSMPFTASLVWGTEAGNAINEL